MKISEDEIEKINNELDNLLEVLQKINNKNNITSNAMLLITEIEWYYKTLSLKGYDTNSIERSFIYYKFVNIKKVTTNDDLRIIFLDVIIGFWIRSYLLRKLDMLVCEQEIDEIISTIQCINFLKFLKKKNEVEINHDGFLINEFLPALMFISKEIIFKGMKIIKLERADPPLPDFVIKFTYKDSIYLKPIEITTLSNYNNYDCDWPIISDNTKNQIYKTLSLKYNNKNSYELEINDKFINENYKILPVTVVATSLFSFISETRLISLLDYIVEKSSENLDLAEALKTKKIGYDIIIDNQYFYFLFFKFDNNLESLESKDIDEWCIYNKKFIDQIIKKWNIDIDKYDLEELWFHVNNRKYTILLKNYYYHHKLEKGNELYNDLIKTLKYDVDEEKNIVYKNNNINKLQKNMWVELYVTIRYKGKLCPPKTFGLFKYKG